MAQTKVKLISDGVIVQSNLHASHGITTAHIGEGSNLYYTNARSRAAISVSGNALSYNSSTGVITSNFEESPTFTGNILLDGTNQLHFVAQSGESNTEPFRITRSSDKMYFTYGENAGDEAFYIESDGEVIFEENVGIQTTNPQGALHVYSGTSERFLITGDVHIQGSTDLNINGTSRRINFTAGNGTIRTTTANNLIFQTNSSTALELKSNLVAEFTGTVGIGTGSPTNMLSIKGASGSSKGLDIYHSNGNKVAELIHNGSGDEGMLRLLDSNSETVRIAGENNVDSYINSGKLGIGTTAPAANLHISASNNAELMFTDTNAGTNLKNYSIYNDTGKLHIRRLTDAYSGFTPTMTFDQSSVGIGNASPSRELDIQAGSGWAEIALRGTTGAGGSLEFWTTTTKRAEIFADTEDIVFRNTATNQERMRITSTGNVGIGVSSPGESLDISGNMAIRSTHKIYFNHNTNTARYIGASSHNDLDIAADDDINYRSNFNRFFDGSTEFARLSGSTVSWIANGSNKKLGIGTTSPQSNLHIASSTPKLRLEDTDGGYAEFAANNTDLIINVDPSDAVGNSTIQFEIDGVEYMRLQQQGRLGIGTNSPSEILQTNKNSAGNIVGGYFTNSQANTGAESVSLAFGLNRSGGDFVRQTKAITFGAEQQWTGTPSTVDGYLAFSTMQNEATSEVARFTSSQYLRFASGTGGIQFNGDTAPANALDDYEEGTFTPAIGDGTYTYSYRRGHYQKIGNTVQIHIGFKINSASSVGTSTAHITGLPFAGMSWGSYQEPHERCGVAGICVTANLSSHLSFYVSNSGSQLNARTSANNVDEQVNSNQLWQNGTFIKLQLSYTVS